MSIYLVHDIHTGVDLDCVYRIRLGRSALDFDDSGVVVVDREDKIGFTRH